VGKIIFSGVAILALIFGCLNVYDYFKFKKGKHEEAKLKLPKFLKKRIDTLIREKMEMKNTIIAAIIIGFGVSVGGFICTGQVYLPTIMFVVTQYSALKIKGLAYLFLYNLAFVMPLIIIFTAAYKGTESINLSLFWRKHAKLSKLAASFVFFLLAGLLIFYTYF
jgi:cytochrome c biogenesis protein CcdA